MSVPKTTLADQIAPGATGLEQLRAMIAAGGRPPIGDTLEFSLTEAGDGWATFEGLPGRRAYNPIGTVHGGYAATLLDSACGCAVHSTLAVGEGYTSLDLTVKFLKAVTVESGRLRAVGTVMQRGRRTALAEAKLYDGRDKLVAYASSSCLIF